MVTFRHDSAGTAAPVWAGEVEARDLPPLELGDVGRLVVLAAHPDDETLGAGGLVTLAHAVGLDVQVVVATRGEGSHPRSPTCTPRRLAEVREQELADAVGVLAPGARADVLGLPDGHVGDHEDDVVDHLVSRIGDGRGTLVLAPWRADGHPDHEAAGRAAATAAARTGARLLEYPVWFWHWGSPSAAPWSSARRLDLTQDEQDRKASAVARHRTQVEPLSDLEGDEALLGADLLAHFHTPYEIYWEGPVLDDALDVLHAEHDDPWGVDRRWYERRKRSLLLAMLPRERFGRAVEVGGSTGALAAALAARCDHLDVVDASRQAVTRARERLGGLAHVDVHHEVVPHWWPGGDALDLVVVSEVAYFLSVEALEGLASRVRATLAADGVVVLSHWRHPVRGWPLDGPTAHARLREAGLPPVVADYRDRDVEVLVLASPGQLPDPHQD